MKDPEHFKFVNGREEAEKQAVSMVEEHQISYSIYFLYGTLEKYVIGADELWTTWDKIWLSRDASLFKKITP